MDAVALGDGAVQDVQADRWPTAREGADESGIDACRPSGFLQSRATRNDRDRRESGHSPRC